MSIFFIITFPVGVKCLPNLIIEISFRSRIKDTYTLLRFLGQGILQLRGLAFVLTKWPTRPNRAPWSLTEWRGCEGDQSHLFPLGGEEEAVPGDAKGERFFLAGIHEGIAAPCPSFIPNKV